MSTQLETRPPQTTAPLPTIEAKLPTEGPQRTRRWLAWIAVPVILFAVGIAFLVSGSEDTTPVDTYTPQGMQPGYVDGWFRADVPVAEAPQPAATSTAVDGWYAPLREARLDDTPLRQGYTPGLPDGWFDPSSAMIGGGEEVATPAYPARLVR